TLAYAHSRGVIHRDLKPANVMVGAFGEVQVMDWGLARVLACGGRPVGQAFQPDRAECQAGKPDPNDAPGPPELTAARTALGTPAYRAREQARGEIARLDERCDVFGLGAMLCQILTGQPPYTGVETLLVLDRARRGDLGDAHARLDHCGADAELVQL